MFIICFSSGLLKISLKFLPNIYPLYLSYDMEKVDTMTKTPGYRSCYTCHPGQSIVDAIIWQKLLSTAPLQRLRSIENYCIFYLKPVTHNTGSPRELKKSELYQLTCIVETFQNFCTTALFLKFYHSLEQDFLT